MLYAKELQKTNQEEVRIEKCIKRKRDTSMSNERAMIILLIAGLMKKALCKISKYFAKPYNHFDENVKVELDLSNCGIKTLLKGATEIGMSNLTLKPDLAKLKAEVDKINVDKLKTLPVDLSKLNDVVYNQVFKKLFMMN